MGVTDTMTEATQCKGDAYLLKKYGAFFMTEVTLLHRDSRIKICALAPPTGKQKKNLYLSTCKTL